MHFLCPNCAPSKPIRSGSHIYELGIVLTDHSTEYANMMASLFNAPKPQKMIKPSEPKTSEVPIDLTQSKVAEVTVDKKDSPKS